MLEIQRGHHRDAGHNRDALEAQQQQDRPEKVHELRGHEERPEPRGRSVALGAECNSEVAEEQARQP